MEGGSEARGERLEAGEKEADQSPTVARGEEEEDWHGEEDLEACAERKEEGERVHWAEGEGHELAEGLGVSVLAPAAPPPAPPAERLGSAVGVSSPGLEGVGGTVEAPEGVPTPEEGEEEGLPGPLAQPLALPCTREKEGEVVALPDALGERDEADEGERLLDTLGAREVEGEEEEKEEPLGQGEVESERETEGVRVASPAGEALPPPQWRKGWMRRWGRHCPWQLGAWAWGRA